MKIKQNIVNTFILFYIKLKGEYNMSIMGSFWLFIKPFLTTLTFAFVMSRIGNLSMKEFFSFIAINLSTWIFISTVISMSSVLFIAKRSLLINRKINHFLIVMSFILKSLYIYLISMFLPIAISIFLGSLKISFVLLAYIPYLLILVYILFCCAFIIACIYAYIEDIAYIIEISMPIMMWLTPVVYPIEKIPGLFIKIQMINPFYIMISPFISIFYKNQLPSLTENLSLLVLIILSTSIYFLVYKTLYKKIIYRLSVK